MNALIVAANNNEDLNWLGKVQGWQPYINTEYHPKGREAYSYLQWLTSGTMHKDHVFCQGDPFTHDPDFLQHLENPEVRYFGKVEECNPDAAPHYDAPLYLYCAELDLPCPDTFKFVAGAQYRVSKQQVTSVRKNTYKRMYIMSSIDQKAPWVFERLWPLIWQIRL